MQELCCEQVVSALHQHGEGWDSGALATHLERLARKAELPEAWQLALDMYARLGMHDKHCQMLLAKVNCFFAKACTLWRCYMCMHALKGAPCMARAAAQGSSTFTLLTALDITRSVLLVPHARPHMRIGCWQELLIQLLCSIGMAVLCISSY